jgi:phage terminase large subunit GpA-like protein
VIDSGDGDWTDRCYAFCFQRLSRRVMAGKGVYGTRPSIQASKSKVKGGRIFLIGVDGIKTTIISRLSRGQSIRSSNTLEPSYYEQLASERKVVRYSRGMPVRRFERKPGAHAEALDCLVYAFAARGGVNVMLGQREQDLRSAEPPKLPTFQRRIRRSQWMQA